MLKRLKISTLLILITLLLVACGGKQGVTQIDYKKLQKKIENNDTFWLITLDVDEKTVKEQNVIEMFDGSLQKVGIDEVYYVNIWDLTEKEKVELAESNLHPVMVDNNIHWETENTALVYVQNGGVLSLTGFGLFSSKYMQDGGVDQHEVDENITNQIERLKEFNINY